MRKPSGVIFDFGDTVMGDEVFNPTAGYARLLKFVTSSPHPTAEEIQVVGDEMSRELNPLKRNSMLEVTQQSFWRLLFGTLGVTFSLSDDQIDWEFWQGAVTHTPSDGLVEVLETLEANGIKTGILSNASWSGTLLKQDLAQHNIAHRFSFVISSADYGFRKPNRRIFEIAIKKMDLPPGDIWFTGDSLDNDVAGAIGAGLFPVWYNPKKKPLVGDYDCFEIDHWRKFRDKIEMMCRQ